MSKYRATLSGSDRGVSPVIGTLLLVAAVLVVAASVAVVGFDLSSDIREPAPTVAESTGKLDPVDGGDGGIVQVTHISGDSVEVKNIRIVVDATDACEKRSTITNLPADYSFGQFGDENFEGDDLFAKDYIFDQEPWDGGVLLEENNNTFSSGDSFEFRIASTQCDLNRGDSITVRVVHIPSDSIIIEQLLRPF